MNITEEKKFIYEMMTNITEERRSLTDQYFSLKERLDALHKLEEKGLSELSTKGFFDLFNDRETQLTIQNMNREVEHRIARRQEKDLAIPRYDKVAETLERGAQDRAASASALDHVNMVHEAEKEKADRIAAWEQKQSELAKQEEQALIEQALQESQQIAMRLEAENAAKKSEYTPVSTHIIPKELIEQEKEKELREKNVAGSGRQVGRANSGLTTKEATFLIVKILKEAGRPLSISEIHERLVKASGYEVTKKNTQNNILRRAMLADPKIDKAAKGFYQYNKTKG